MDHNLSELSFEGNDSPMPDWLKDVPQDGDVEAGFTVAIHGQPDGHMEIWGNFDDVVLLHLMLEGSLQSIRTVLVSHGYVMDEDANGGWRKA